MRYLYCTCIVLGMVLLAGCVNLKPKSDTRKQFILGAEAKAVVADTLAVFVERIHLPSYVNENALEYLRSNGEILPVNGDRWAEPINVGVGRTLFQHINNRSSISGGYYPWPKVDRETSSLFVRFVELVATEQGFIKMSGTWEIRHSDRRSVKLGSFSITDISWEVGHSTSLVEGINEGLFRIASEVSSGL